VRGRLVAVALVLACSAGDALAQTQDSKSDQAEALYQDARASMRAGRLQEGCEQLERSQALDRGAGTMLTLAECYELLGRTASAFDMYRQAAVFARDRGQTERARQGERRAAALAPRLSMLTLQVAPENAELGMTLLRDGEVVADAWWNVPVPVDPGLHELRARAPGRREWSTDVRVGPEADSAVVTVPAMSPAHATPPKLANEASGPLVTAGPVHSSGALPRPPAIRWPAERIAAVVTLGIGVGALGAGAVFGLGALSKQADADACAKDARCTDANGQRAIAQARDAAALANVFTLAGAALAASGAVLYLLATDDPPPSEPLRTTRKAARASLLLELAPRAAGLRWGGVF
jgi:serine/threonine-protein kinase